jgi:hypothetical protein
MLPLLWCALADTVVAEYTPETVFVHEWGVVVVDEGYPQARGNPYGRIDQDGYLMDFPEVEVKAPVVYFHGEECSGDFTVTIPNGSFTSIYPFPDSAVNEGVFGLATGGDVATAVWEDLKVVADTPVQPSGPVPVPDIPDCFSWAVPMWREVPANLLRYEPRGYADVFLYYESSLYDTGMFAGEYFGYEGAALVFFADDGQLACVRATVPGEADAAGPILSDREIMEVLCRWGHNALKTEEIAALWNTWEPCLRTRCEQEGRTMMMFPLSDEQEEAISHISFVPNRNGLLVRYDRLLVGLGAI